MFPPVLINGLYDLHLYWNDLGDMKAILIFLATFGMIPFAVAQPDTIISSPMGGGSEGASLRLTLDECITMARCQSVDAAVALGELRSAYWQWRSYRADLLPEVSLQGTLPSYNKRYSSYQQSDGSMTFVHNDYLGLNGSLYVTQKLWPTGGTLSVESSLDYLHQSSNSSPTGGGSEGANQFMSLPIAITLSQPLFSVNHLKWNRRIEPLRYREAQARFLTETEQVAMQAISLFFNLLLAGEQVRIAEQNLQTAEKLYEVAQAKRRMGSISENDVLQMRLGMLNARSHLATSKSTCQARQFALRSFLDVESDIAPVVPDDVPAVYLSFDDVLSHALQNNAHATTMRRRQIEADYSVAAARANRQRAMPTATCSATTWCVWASAFRCSTGASAGDIGRWPSRTATSSRGNFASRLRTFARTSLYLRSSLTTRLNSYASPARPTLLLAVVTTPTSRRSR